MKWTGLSEEEKNKQYSKMTCHELNLFCYFKDRAYFDAVIRPFVACKIEKTFIDYYLLQMTEYILQHTALPKLHKLNALEKCLLVHSLVDAGRKDEAKEIAQLIKDEAEKNVKIDPNVENKIFDIVLSLNALKSHGELDDLADYLDGEARDAPPSPGAMFGMPPPPAGAPPPMMGGFGGPPMPPGAPGAPFNNYASMNQVQNMLPPQMMM